MDRLDSRPPLTPFLQQNHLERVGGRSESQKAPSLGVVAPVACVWQTPLNASTFAMRS